MMKKNRKKTVPPEKIPLLELLITEDGDLLLANADSTALPLVKNLSGVIYSPGSFYCG